MEGCEEVAFSARKNSVSERQ